MILSMFVGSLISGVLLHKIGLFFLDRFVLIKSLVLFKIFLEDIWISIKNTDSVVRDSTLKVLFGLVSCHLRRFVENLV